MARELIDIVASVRLKAEDSHVDAFVVTAAGQSFCVASLAVYSTATISEVWREDFRMLARRISEDALNAQGFRPHWINVPKAL